MYFTRNYPPNYLSYFIVFKIPYILRGSRVINEVYIIDHIWIETKLSYKLILSWLQLIFFVKFLNSLKRIMNVSIGNLLQVEIHETLPKIGFNAHKIG